VLKGEIHGAKVFLLSDLGRPGQEVLLNQGAADILSAESHTDDSPADWKSAARLPDDLHADIVVTGLPEKTEPLSAALLDVIQPKVIIVADSEFPATKRAPAALRERLAQRQIPVIYTRKSGAVTIVLQPGGWELRTMDGTRIKNRQN
jgi:beta-lactamase superfamily II metal-dependent hydrolase